MYTQNEEPLLAAEVPEFLQALTNVEKDWHAYFADLRRSDVLESFAIDLAETLMEQMFDTIATAVKK